MTEFQRQRGRANLLVILLAIAFAGCVPFRHDGGIWPWMFVILEASLAAAFADWFAITALFRRPLGLPVPHTAIVPRKHREIGKALAALIRDRLLPKETLRAKIGEFEGVGPLLARIRKTGPDRIAGFVTDWLQGIGANDSQADRIHGFILMILRRAPAARLLGSLLERGLGPEQQERIFDLLLSALEAFRRSPERTAAWRKHLEEILLRRHPECPKRFLLGLARVTGALNEEDAVADALDAIHRELSGARSQPDHELRKAMSLWAGQWARDFQEDTPMAREIDGWWQELVATIDLREPIRDLAGHLLSAETLAEWQPVLASGLSRLVESLEQDAEAAGRLNAGLRTLLLHLVDPFYQLLDPFVSYVFTSRFPEEDLVRFLEEEAGDVLQRLRITGTIVGGLAGLGIAWLTGLSSGG